MFCVSTQVRDTRTLMPMEMLLHTLKIENLIMKTFRWKHTLNGLAYAVVIKVNMFNRSHVYVRTIECGALNGMHRDVLKDMGREYNAETVLHDVAVTHDDFVLYRLNNSRLDK